MKVVHVLKKIETIDSDIKDLRKMEKSLQKNKSFSTPIYLSIEKQINILLGERIKLLELKIDNPPEYMLEQIEGAKSAEEKSAGATPEKKKTRVRSNKARATARKSVSDIKDEDIPLMAQDFIDDKIKQIERNPKTPEPKTVSENSNIEFADDDSVKLLDIALEKGTLSKPEIEKSKKKVKFFRENFPGGEY